MDFTEDEPEQVQYCKHCLEFNVYSPLKDRIYPDGQEVQPEKENWRMCYECGSVYAVYELEKQSKIKNAVETISSPLESGSEFLAVDFRNRKKRLQEFDDDGINDDDVKRELRKGDTLLSYSEEMPQ